MLIAQITDTHIGFDGGGEKELNCVRLAQVVEAICGLDVAPDLVLLTGDIADKGAPESYEITKDVLATLPCPVFVCPGNHDNRAALIEALRPKVDENGFVQYTIEDFPVRIVVADTLEEGRHGGAFCETRAAWLDAALAKAPDIPTLLAIHHPPADTGVPWMGAAPGEAWAERLTAVVSRHPQVQTVVSGHMHLPVAMGWAGSTLVVAPSAAPNLSLTLSEVDFDAPDGRALVELGPPGYALHQWTDGRILTHFRQVGEHRVVWRFGDLGSREFLRHLAKERREG
jgi:Icc protein